MRSPGGKLSACSRDISPRLGAIRATGLVNRDDLVKIGAESTPWFCSENNVYIAFEFNPKSHGEQSDTNDSDVLKRVSVFHQLEGCL